MSNWLKMLTPARHVVHVTNTRYDSLLSVRPFLSVTLLSRKWDHCSLKGEGDLYSGQRSPTLFGLTDDMHKSSAAKGREEPSKFKFQNVPLFMESSIDWPIYPPGRVHYTGTPKSSCCMPDQIFANRHILSKVSGK